MKLFKLTSQAGITPNKTQWGENITHTIPEYNRTTVLCSSGVVHAYESVNQALLLNPLHAAGEVVAQEWDKLGCHERTTIKHVDVPDWYANAATRKKVRLQFAILCAAAAYVVSKTTAAPDAAAHAAEAAAQAVKGATRPTTWAAARAAASAAAHAVDAAKAANVEINIVELADRAVELVTSKK